MLFRKTVFAVFTAVLLMISTPLIATESRIIAGDGLVGDGSIVMSIWKLGLCPITAGQDFGFHVAETANSTWPGAFSQCGAFRIVSVPDANPSTLTPDDIIRLGEDYDVHALVWGIVDQAKNRRGWYSSGSNPSHEVAVTISFRLYETQTGSLLWERTLKKDRTVTESESEGILERFASNIVTDMVDQLITDGIQGRDLSLNSPPIITCANPMILFRTSASRIRGTVTDDFGINEVALSCGESEALLNWAVDSTPEFEINEVLTIENISGDSITITARDSQGLLSTLVVPAYTDSVSIEGLISNITADSVFINVGSEAGVEQGMIFTVETSVDIMDPETGAVLGSSQLETGKIEVETADAQFAICRVIEGDVTVMGVSDRVY